jgi:hypothetical protein
LVVYIVYVVLEKTEMADVMKVVREWEAARERRKLEKTGDTGDLPWAGYNGGQQFVCDKCGARFDTSTGRAKHEVYGCDWRPPTTPPATRTLPSCPKCGSFALYREKDGTLTCQTCEDKE